eukprot:TRINITY_DN3875_c0_g1_i2.p1 TRINITY_DN3875_c0_g1~~TRINITY_DN3875_c0_g1_i2.p1  ORF type:complete len:254 (-),score=39.02 TRINITY_DN3875_c0_g1_i2:58-819(-)
MGPAMWGSCFSWGIYLLTYEEFKGLNRKITNKEILSPFGNLISGIEAGMVMAVLTNPIWVVKTRMQVQLMKVLDSPSSSPSRSFGSPILKRVDQKEYIYKGVYDGLKMVYKEEGVRGLYSGLTPALFLSVNGALQFTAYEAMKLWAKSLRPQDHTLASWEYFTMGAISKLFSTFVTFPFSVIKTRLQVHKEFFSSKALYQGIWDTFASIVRKEGVKGLYSGFVPSILRNVPYSALTLAVYEKLVVMSSYFVPI